MASRMRVLGTKLIKDNFPPGDRLVETKLGPDTSDISAQRFVAPSRRNLLLVHERIERWTCATRWPGGGPSRCRWTKSLAIGQREPQNTKGKHWSSRRSP